MPKAIMLQHEITERLEKQSGVQNLKIIRLKGYDPSWDIGAIRDPAIDIHTETKLQDIKRKLQAEVDIA